MFYHIQIILFYTGIKSWNLFDMKKLKLKRHEGINYTKSNCRNSKVRKLKLVYSFKIEGNAKGIYTKGNN